MPARWAPGGASKPATPGPGPATARRSTGAGPRAEQGFDIALNELDDGYLVRAGSDRGRAIVAGGTDTHLMLVDVFSKGMLGSEAENALGQAGITVNKNTVPFETRSPFVTSGIRIGTPAATSHGLKETEMKEIAGLIADALANAADDTRLDVIKARVNTLMKRFPLYADRLK